MTNWRTSPAAHGQIKRWLTAGGSLSARLAATGKVFSVQVLRQGRAPLNPDEALALGLGQQRNGYAREVLLRVDGVPVVFARSVTAQHNAVGAWRSVQGLGNRPLADVLFRRSGISRQPLSFSSLARCSPMQRHATKAWANGVGSPVLDSALDARRSVFVRQRATLLVMEVFIAQATSWPGLVSAKSIQPVWKELR
jgi:chorismate--pyruvate lyase